MLLTNEIRLYGSEASGNLFVQPVDGHDMELMASEAEHVRRLSGSEDFCILAVPVSDWDRDLTPWSADPVFGKRSFGDGAPVSLRQLEEAGLLSRRCCLCGYSLAGLFALWAAYQTDALSGAAAVSPSLWYPGWIAYAEKTPVRSPAVYLSLGDREERSRNPVMASVGDAVRAQHALLLSAGIRTALEWNPGSHFVDSDLRMARGIAWMLMEQEKGSER